MAEGTVGIKLPGCCRYDKLTSQLAQSHGQVKEESGIQMCASVYGGRGMGDEGGRVEVESMRV